MRTQRKIKRDRGCSVLESRQPKPPPNCYSHLVSRIDNDTGGAATLEPWFAYADGAPALPGAEMPLEAGGSVELVLSDVVSSWLAGANAYRIAVVTAPDAM